MRTITLFLCCSCLLTLSAQKDTLLLDAEYLATKTKIFTLDEQGIRGPSLKSIKGFIQESQFLILGEYHGSAQVSKFTKALVPHLAAAGYQYFACEVGPHSARKLKELSTPPTRTTGQLAAFNQRYAFSEIGDVPIPFFENQEDADFLQAFRGHDFEIFGLDQEYFSAVFFLLDELLVLAEGKSDFSSIQLQQEKAKKIIKNWLIKDDESELGFAVFAEILEEPTVNTFFDTFNEKDTLALKIIADLKISWNIYDHYQGGISHQKRLDYMRANFRRNYSEAIQKHPMPKVVVKIGGLHARRNASSDPDIGPLLEELATQNESQSTHLSFISRYFRTDDQIVDFLKTRAKRYGRYELFLAAAKPHQGQLIDLKAIRADLASGRIKYPADPNRKFWDQLIQGFDYQVILPADYAPTSMK